MSLLWALNHINMALKNIFEWQQGQREANATETIHKALQGNDVRPIMGPPLRGLVKIRLRILVW